jgi:phosphatidylinositol alpha-1,6-mannosyltransferase
LGRVDDADLIPLLGSADAFAMLCRNRWAGLEQEGFGIVFLEAAACGVPVVAGRSGGSAEAVIDGQTGLFFAAQEPAALQDALTRAAAIDWDAQALRTHAESFGRDRFVARIRAFVETHHEVVNG